eukprot:TRINITY_DN1104_c0_g1_i1.p1 TRINITY_DN1104_c0_g1~~TRINITY_DN1104_c0_g1_i1.p1  ORF type:complete len:318 (-),score=55.83 TRINITY_DN1104_c0_g1_i1:1569-2450(-)
MAIIASKGVPPLAEILVKGNEQPLREVAAWALGQLASHSASHARSVADDGGLVQLAETFQSADCSEGLGHKCRTALMAAVAKLRHLPSLVKLFRTVISPEILELILRQTSTVLSRDPSSRPRFEALGGFTRASELLLAAPSLGGGLPDSFTKVSKPPNRANENQLLWLVQHQEEMSIHSAAIRGHLLSILSVCNLGSVIEEGFEGEQWGDSKSAEEGARSQVHSRRGSDESTRNGFFYGGEEDTESVMSFASQRSVSLGRETPTLRTMSLGREMVWSTSSGQQTPRSSSFGRL